ncbi:MAG: ergosterol biosynthesis protein [Trizodia sp. TS-e1964]|nr:MAG: ergosterol biosynthesis protein [Trizodia sp. TS-e1964]
MDNLRAYLPQSEGLLPQWLLLVSLISIGNSIQAYSTLAYTRRVYAGSSTSLPPHVSPATPLSSRTFGTWSLLSGLLRLYAAYHVGDAALYELVMCSYVVGCAHFASEWLVFGSAKWNAGLASPLVVAGGSLVWMLTQWGFYVR